MKALDIYTFQSNGVSSYLIHKYTVILQKLNFTILMYLNEVNDSGSEL